MQQKTKNADQVYSWEQEIVEVIKQVETISHHEKNALQLYLETHPLPFQPSPVLVQLLQNDRRRRSCKQGKLQLKSADYLDRKFESEIRQHYEMENAQSCGKWKKFHVQASNARQQLSARIKRDFRHFCHQLGISPDEIIRSNEEQGDNQLRECSLSAAAPVPSDTTSTKTTASIEDCLRLHLAQEWVHQERFNIQEAFTNQTKKLQEDLATFLDQQEAEFLEERRKVMNASSMQFSHSENELKRNNRSNTSSKFQSSTKRGMLLQTAPPLRVEPTSDRQQQWKGVTTGTRVRSSSRHIRTEVDEAQDKLDELQRRLQICKEAAEAKRKDGMQWIGRQCAHLFAQLDCKETEARVIALLTEEELTQFGVLRHRVYEIVKSLGGLRKQQCSKEGDGLPLLPNTNSIKQVPLQPKHALKALKESKQLNSK